MSDMQALDKILSELPLRYKPSAANKNKTLSELEAEWYNQAIGHLNENDGYNCDKCNNRGDFATVDENDYVMHHPCRCANIRAALKRAKASGLGDVLTDCTFDKFKTAEAWQQKIKEIAQTFCTDETAKWFFIGGQVGSGKTHLCTAICGHYIKVGLNVRYMLWAEDSKRLKAVINDNSYQDLINDFKKAEVLYIDDFLKVKKGESPTPADINLAFEIINHRLLDKQKITVISSEKTLDEMLDYDEGAISRISQKSGDYKINIGKDRSKNYRLNGGN